MIVPGNLMHMHVTGWYKLWLRQHTACMLGGAIPCASGVVIKNVCFLMLHWYYKV